MEKSHNPKIHQTFSYVDDDDNDDNNDNGSSHPTQKVCDKDIFVAFLSYKA